MRIFKPDISVELFAEHGSEIVAEQLGIGSVNHADRAFETWFSKGVAQGRAIRCAPIDKTPRVSGAPEQIFETVFPGRPHVFHLHRRIPVRGCRNRAAIRAEADGYEARAIGRPAEFA